MARSLGHGPFLAPAGHAAVDQLGIAGHAVLRTQAQPFRHARAKAFEDRIGTLAKAKHRFPARFALEIYGEGAAIAHEHVLRCRGPGRGTIDADHLGAHVRQHHAAEGPRANPRQFNNL